jgi:hypothetical protein
LAQALKNNEDAVLEELTLNNNYITRFGAYALNEAVDLALELNEAREMVVQF